MLGDYGNPVPIPAPRQGPPNWRKSGAAEVNTVPQYNFRVPRVYIDAPLAAGQSVSFDRGQANYLANVLRLKEGEALLLVNGRDGEWQAHPAETGKRTLTATAGPRQPQPP